MYIIVVFRLCVVRRICWSSDSVQEKWGEIVLEIVFSFANANCLFHFQMSFFKVVPSSSCRYVEIVFVQKFVLFVRPFPRSRSPRRSRPRKFPGQLSSAKARRGSSIEVFRPELSFSYICIRQPTEILLVCTLRLKKLGSPHIAHSYHSDCSAPSPPSTSWTTYCPPCTQASTTRTA